MIIKLYKYGTMNFIFLEMVLLDGRVFNTILQTVQLSFTHAESQIQTHMLYTPYDHI